MPIQHFKLFNLLLLIIALVGCSASNNDLKDYIATTRAKPGGVIEPLPELLPPESFTYDASGLRSPFVQPLKDDGKGGGKKTSAPDVNRVKEVLENVSIDQLSMVGTLQSENSKLWALVSDGTTGVYRVAEGNYLGRNYGKIVKVYLDKMDIIEVVPDGRGGWLERPKTIEMKEK